MFNDLLDIEAESIAEVVRKSILKVEGQVHKTMSAHAFK
jgi:hypothetical protein